MSTIETKQSEAGLLTRQPCEVYSRIVGYIRPVTQWNDGKQAEFHDRLEYGKRISS
ncbi:MAG: anaerobic ribonucleoside-triphosphate reductase [Patescibacteria group bacterium]